MEQTNSNSDQGASSCCGHSAELTKLESHQAALESTVSTSRRFAVSGLDCIEEVRILRRAVGPLVGGDEGLAFDAINGRMSVLVSSSEASDKDIISAVAATGMSATSDEGQGTAAAPAVDRGPLYATFVSGALLLLGIVIHLIGIDGPWSFATLLGGHGEAGPPMLEILAWVGATVAGTRYVAPKAWYALKTLRPDMNLLMVVAVVGAMVLGEWFEAATVAFLFALSLLLERWSVGRARRAVEALLDLTPASIQALREDGTEVEIPATEAEVGTRFVVRAGDRVALDGTVSEGAGSVDQAPITGESLPVLKEVGDEVFAGTINGEGTLTVVSSRPADDTVLARIIRTIGDAHERRAPVEQWVERFAARYTPAVMILALLIALVPPLLFGAAWQPWIYNALVLLVIACPCALVISTPVSIVAALASAARAGVLVKGGGYIELPARLDALALDKTGTLTFGTPQVSDIVPLNAKEANVLLAEAAAIERRSSHPLAAAIARAATEQGLDPAAAQDVVTTAGKGLTGRLGERELRLGSWRFIRESANDQDIDPDGAIAAQVAQLEANGRTVVALSDANGVRGLLGLSDTVRPEARAVIAQLHALGVKEIVMLTGDNAAAADLVARQVGIDTVRAGLLPEDKVAEVEALAARHTVVAMIGDGVNDAPAMARANFGIAMGAIGSDAAIETADIALMSDELVRVPWLVSHAKRTLTVIRQNIVFSVGIKVVFMLLTLFGIASLWGAIVADVGATLLVVANALRLLRDRR
ncbi:heavy metal translocating P-type ATPase [Granulosicoccus antarcticus]|uniref:P-type Zn(2+) transporter n=1 Tax=Granulosicoccus antarcticus IMCC3135 TaxID=1192854 RepID=A0A2Z2NZ27_9GAMM|nr:heavy metal translocating P-type ATPase [Granulosicoccus antarcticus]ASJ76706.1 putative cadmium-transporting ATPase [Granulosicoccus antarcticus IMCC3135]